MILRSIFCFILLFGINEVYIFGSEETDSKSKSKTEDNNDNGDADPNPGPGPEPEPGSKEPQQEEEDYSYSGEPEAVIQPAQIDWPQGIVPYYIDSHTYDKVISNRIRLAMSAIESVSCIMFKESPMRPPEDAGFTWLYITNPEKARECKHTSFVGSQGHALLVLGYDCLQRRDIIHALLHVLGFNDEVTHPQRDSYVRILWQNIQPSYRPLFRINTNEPPHKVIVEYDTMSVMHFHDRAYSSNGGATVVPLISGLLISPSDQLSQLDIMKLRLAFGHECNRRKVGNLIKTCENAVRGGKAAQDEIDVQDENVVEDENTAQGGSGSSEQVADKLVIKHPETLESQSGDHSGDASVAKHSSGDEKLYLDRTRFPVPYKMRHYRKKKKTIYPKKVTRATIYPRKDKKERFTFFRPIGPTPEIFSTVSDHSS